MVVNELCSSLAPEMWGLAIWGLTVKARALGTERDKTGIM
jgi:hypothetical protein